MYSINKDTSLLLYTYDLKETFVKLKKYDYMIVTNGAYCQACEKDMNKKKVLYIYVGNDGDESSRQILIIDRKKKYPKHHIYFLRTEEQKQYYKTKYGNNELHKCN